MKILFFTKGDKSIGSSRQRVWFLAEHLQKQYGYHYKILYGIKYSFWSLTRERFIFIKAVLKELKGDYEIIFVHKSLFPIDIICFILFFKFLTRKKLVYDLDDAEWYHSFSKTYILVKFADVVFCGSDIIKKWVSTRAKKCVFIPTVVDYDIYSSQAVIYEDREEFTIGWAGVGKAHFIDGHFKIIRTILKRLTKNGFKLRFVIIGAQNYKPLKDYFKESSFKTIFIDKLNWDDPVSVPRAIHDYNFDIGLMPISNTEFNRAKCAFKAIEYMACGVPTIASSVGEADILIKDGVNGFLVKTENEWIEQSIRLLQNKDLRRKMGENAKHTIKEKYSFESNIPLVSEALKTLFI
ncbi:glycosyltransferase [Patescibacteria group bacterium]